ncbi:MAG TPA: type I DNA topoisomerase [Candidatus Limnocylindrales bacterium]|nr:type I DNA topoisomerase [Candidatus Limnocylindrales bacterium]
MPKHLVIVESPAKARTIERYLGGDYQVLASYGHVRDLPENPGKGKFGVDVDHDFSPEYVIPEDRRKQVSAIEKAARGADDVWLASDLDREGEAIAWHVAEAANVPASKRRRVTFSEITEGAIREAFASPRGIDQDLVDAQQARRIVDRLVGYTLSPLLSRKVRGGLSAGRVQSVAVRMVVEREREIRAFTAKEYWTLEALLATADGTEFSADLVRIDGNAVDIGDGETAEGHAAAIRALSPVVDSLATRRSKRNPAPPFTTSTLQQEASRKLGYSPKRTMSIAQRLYEGVDTPDGHVGLITYMRTDSTAIAAVAMAEAQEVIRQRFGEPYGTGKGRTFKTKQKGAQEAHESIRPTSFLRDPDSMRAHLKADELKLYRLIWQRAIASQMAPKELETATAELTAGVYRLRASATRTLFDGFARVYTEGLDDAAEEAERTLPPLAEGDVTAVRSVTPTQHFTEPPPRYTEATLIKALEEHGIGRPSTYAATISTILERGYVRVEERRLHPEEIGEIVTDLLVDHFGEYVDLAFTARMEEELDEVARGEREWVPLLRAFFTPLKSRVDEKRKELKRADFTTEATDEVCSEGHPMVIRLGRNGKFLACSTYPDHKETRPLPGEEAPRLEGDGDPCPQCGEGVLATKRGRFGAFVGCSRYPDCTYIRKDGPPPPDQLPYEVTCPKNGDGHLVARRARRTGNVFWGCSAYPKCDFTTNDEPTGARHEGHPDAFGAVVRKGEAGLCMTCGAEVPLPDAPLPGLVLPGGPANPAALEKPARGGAGRRAGGAARGTTRRSGGRTGSPPRTGSGSRRASG